MSAVPVRRAFPNGVKLLDPRRSLSETVVNGVPSDCDRYVLLREVNTFYISSGLCNVYHCSKGSNGGMLFQEIKGSSGISMNLILLGCFYLVWCLMDRCIYC